MRSSGVTIGVVVETLSPILIGMMPTMPSDRRQDVATVEAELRGCNCGARSPFGDLLSRTRPCARRWT